MALATSSALAAQAVTTDKGAKVLVSELPGVDPKSLQVHLGSCHSGPRALLYAECQTC